jgi:tetratricopeptide (TPR) repeat protein
MKETQIKILGRDNNEVGDNLEDLAKELLAKTGFGSFIRNAYKTGAEIDLKATHRVTGEPLLCECKAKEAEIGTTAVRLFYSEWEKERATEDRLVGLMISTSGFNGTAKQWYEELSDEKKRFFQLVDCEKLMRQLTESLLINSSGAVITSLNRRFNIGEFHAASLIYSSHGFSWLCEYSKEGHPRFFTIVDGKGEALPNWKSQELAELLAEDVKGLSFFGLDVRRKVQAELLINEDASATSLSKAISESETDVGFALRILLDQGIVAEQGSEIETYRFIRDVVPFVSTAREFIESKDAVLFMKSNYAQEMIHSPAFISYIDTRYKLNMLDEERDVISRVFSISPSALRHAIFQTTDRFLQTRQDIESNLKDSEQREKWLTLHRMSLLQDSVMRAAHDLSGKEYELSGHLSNLGIKRYRLKIGLDAVGDTWEKLSVEAEIMAAIEKAGEDLLAGNLVSSNNPVNAKVWNAMLFLEVKEYSRAIEEFEEALDLCRTKEISVRDHQAVLNNFALVYMRQDDWRQAIRLLDQALELGNPEFAEILSNKLRCHIELGDREGSESLLKYAPTLFPAIETHSGFAAARQIFLESEVPST